MRYICKACNNLSSKLWYYENKEQALKSGAERYYRRQAILAQIKTERGCSDCRFNSHPEALDFDHRPGEVKCFEMSTAWQREASTVEAEIVKCEIVCSNCHRIRTSKRRKETIF